VPFAIKPRVDIRTEEQLSRFAPELPAIFRLILLFVRSTPDFSNTTEGLNQPARSPHNHAGTKRGAGMVRLFRVALRDGLALRRVCFRQQTDASKLRRVRIVVK
jgi:hypothetical protein